MPKTDTLFLKLKEIVGESHIIKDPDKLKDYGLDGKRPKIMVSPETIDQVSRIVAYAGQEHLSIVPRGSGTKMSMGGVPKKMDIVLSTSRLNRVTDCDTDNLTLSAESGMTLNEVQRRLAEERKGYFIPLDPPFTDKATLGGIVATNSSGPRRFLYNTARDLMIGAKAVFPNGDIVISGGKTVKNVSGYDMCKLLIGSFGTLGILCEMTFKLLPLPEKEATLLLSFTSLDRADGFAHEIIQSQLLPASIEMLNAMAVRKMRFPVTLPLEGNYLVAIGLEGVTESIERQVSEISDRGKKQGALETVPLDSEKHHAFWVSLRDFSQGLMEDHPNIISLKSNVLISRLGEAFKSYEKIARESDMDCALVCHSGNGILYTYVLPGRNWRSKTESIVEFIGKLTFEAAKWEGHIIVESSPLAVKEKVDVWGQPRSDYQVMRRLKEEIDPAGILSPGRFVGGI
ncbi:MAG: FAD-binding oxidoreductase [Thermodesulfobacteriota bacterium]|nr:FAD-binding oxidoreductase [Thermodesulfobacteriota bacterium]